MRKNVDVDKMLWDITSVYTNFSKETDYSGAYVCHIDIELEMPNEKDGAVTHKHDLSEQWIKQGIDEELSAEEIVKKPKRKEFNMAYNWMRK